MLVLPVEPALTQALEERQPGPETKLAGGEDGNLTLQHLIEVPERNATVAPDLHEVV